MLMQLRRRPAASTARVLRYRAAPQVVSARHGDRTVLLDPRRGRYFGLDDVGAAIWGLVGEAAPESGATVTEIAAALEGSYAAERGQLERDAEAFLARLVRARLVVKR